MSISYARTRNATSTLLSGIAVPGLMLAADVVAASVSGSRPWWHGQPWPTTDDSSDLVVCNVVV
jgi:hypothetical protein